MATPISEIRAEDHTDSTSLTDRSGGAWSLYSGTKATITAGATPSGVKALTFAGAGSYCRLNDAGLMYLNDAETFFASSMFNNSQAYSPANVGDATGDFATANATVPCWWGVKLKTALVVTSYSIAQSSAARTCKDWKFQGSNDSTTGADGTWTDLDVRTGIGGILALTAYSFTNTTPYRWYRIYVTALNGGDLWYLTRVQFVGAALLGTARTVAEHWLVVKATSVGSGHPVWFTSVGDTRYPFSDNNIYTGWGSAGRSQYLPNVAIMNQWRIYRLVRSSTNTYEYLDKVLQLTAGVGTFVRQPRIGTGGSTAFTGQLAASLVFDGQLSAGEATTLDADLRTTYFGASASGVRRGWGITMN